MDDGPHGHNLRVGRFSAAGQAYFITSNVAGFRPLLNPQARDIIIAALKWSREQARLWLLSYVVMDDHFHLLFVLRTGYTLAKVVGSVKRHAAREINKLRGVEVRFWHEGYHDHAIRDMTDLMYHVTYTHENPVECGWVGQPEMYEWSSAHPSRVSGLDWEALGMERPW